MHQYELILQYQTVKLPNSIDLIQYPQNNNLKDVTMWKILKKSLCSTFLQS